jgi:hypothetical protein
VLGEEATAVPVKETLEGLDASLTNETCPVGVPITTGANTTLNGALWPEVRVRGNVRPCKVKTPPVTLAEETVTVPPEAVIVPDRLLVRPTTTLPKSSEAGVGFKSTITPVPVNATDVGLFVALLVNVTCPEALPPGAEGEKFAV